MAPESSQERTADKIFGSKNDSISAASLQQHQITNNLLGQLVGLQTEQLKLDKQKFNFEAKRINASKFASQEAGIEKFSGGKGGAGWGIKSSGGKGLGIGRLGFTDAALMAALFGPELLRRFTGQLDLRARQTLDRVNKVWDKFTPSIPGFSDFDTRPVAMGLTQWNRQPGEAGQVGRQILSKANLGAKRLFDLNDGTSAIRRGRRFVASNALGGLKQTGSLLEDFGTRIRAPRSTLPGTSRGMFTQFKDPAFGMKGYTAPALNKFLAKGGGLDIFAQGLKNKTVSAWDDLLKSFGNFFKTIKNLRFADLVKGLRGFGDTLKNLGRTITGGSIQAMGKGLQAAPKGIWNMFKGTSQALNTGRKGLSAGLKLTSKGLGRVPILGSLLSAGFGAMEANDEEFQRLREENPMMTDEDIKANLANGTLSKDRNKIISRSAGAGIGAGAGTVAGFLLAGPVGAAIGAWLGENLGKFLGEGIGSVFKGFDWGETFRPVMNTWKEMTTGIGNALNKMAESFGIGGGGSGEGGFITAIKNIGRIIGIIAKVLIKTLVPILQMTFKTIQWVVEAIGFAIQGIVWVVKGIMGIIQKVISWIPSWAGGDKLREMSAGLSEFMSGDVIGKVNSFVDNTNTAFATEQGKSDRASGTGGKYSAPSGKGGSGSVMFASQMDNPGSHVGVDSYLTAVNKPTTDKPVLTSGFRTSSRPNHQGIDIGFKGDKGGQPLFLPSQARITSNGMDAAGYGNYITFTTQSDNLTHLYGHMQAKSPLETGKMFPGGTFAGKVGNTGTSSAPHLHWEVGSVEADVGRGGASLRDPRVFGYGLTTPFEKVDAAVAASSSSSSSGSDIANISGSNTSTNGATITSTNTSADQIAQDIGTLLASTNAGNTGTPIQGLNQLGSGDSRSYDLPPESIGKVINTEANIDDGGIGFPANIN